MLWLKWLINKGPSCVILTPLKCNHRQEGGDGDGEDEGAGADEGADDFFGDEFVADDGGEGLAAVEEEDQ